MTVRLLFQSVLATLSASLLTVAVMRALSIEHVLVSAEKFRVLALGLPIVVALLARRMASSVRATDSPLIITRRWLMWSLGIGINFWCISGLFVGPLLGEVTSVGGLWLLWSVLAGACAGAAFSLDYGRRCPVFLGQSKVRTYAFSGLVILCLLLSATVLIPIALMIIGTVSG